MSPSLLQLHTSHTERSVLENERMIAVPDAEIRFEFTCNLTDKRLSSYERDNIYFSF